MEKTNEGFISDELLAAYLDGNTCADDTMLVIDMMKCDELLQEFMDMSESVDADLEQQLNGRTHLASDIPMTAVAAATTSGGNLCDIQCEDFILKRHDIHFSDSVLEEEARRNEWLLTEGTPLYNIGRLLESMKFRVERKFHSTIEDISNALDECADLIAIVDGGELVGDREKEKEEDRLIGEIPDHAVVVIGVDKENDMVEIHDPQSDNEFDKYPMEQFLDAWADSCHYLITVRKPDNQD